MGSAGIFRPSITLFIMKIYYFRPVLWTAQHSSSDLVWLCRLNHAFSNISWWVGTGRRQDNRSKRYRFRWLYQIGDRMIGVVSNQAFTLSLFRRCSSYNLCEDFVESFHCSPWGCNYDIRHTLRLWGHQFPLQFRVPKCLFPWTDAFRKGWNEPV